MSLAMWCYTAVLLGIAVIAEVAGLGGIPANTAGIGNILLIALLVAVIVAVFATAISRGGVEKQIADWQKFLK